MMQYSDKQEAFDMKRITMTALMTAALFFMTGSAFAQIDEATAPGLSLIHI